MLRSLVPNGQQIALTSWLWAVARICAGRQRGDNQKASYLLASIDWRPAWSPNGQKLAFESDRDGVLDIYVMNGDGANLKRLA